MSNINDILIVNHIINKQNKHCLQNNTHNTHNTHNKTNNNSSLTYPNNIIIKKRFINTQNPKPIHHLEANNNPPRNANNNPPSNTNNNPPSNTNNISHLTYPNNIIIKKRCIINIKNNPRHPEIQQQQELQRQPDIQQQQEIQQPHKIQQQQEIQRHPEATNIPVALDNKLVLSPYYKNIIHIFKSVILVDTSYWLYYCFFTMRKAYERIKPECLTIPNFNMEYNWLADTHFLSLYKQMFIIGLKKLCRKYNTIMSNIIFCMDCPHKSIWRLDYYTEYKQTRPSSHLKNEVNYNAYNLFRYCKKEFIPYLTQSYGVKILNNSKCEADDIIGYCAPHLITKGYKRVIILSNDNDFLQICSNNIIMTNAQYKSNKPTTPPATPSTTTPSTTTPPATHQSQLISSGISLVGEIYLIHKILTGDISDNIKCCKLNKGYVNTGICNTHIINVNKQNCENIISKPHMYDMFKNTLDKIRAGEILSSQDTQLEYIHNFYNNTIIMDFQMIPTQLKTEIAQQINTYIK